MKDKQLEERLQRALNNQLSGLRTTASQRDQFFENATGGRKMKRKWSYTLVLAIVLLLVTVTALAETGAFQKLIEVWNNSFRKMNTTGAVDIVEQFDQEGFEEDYGGVKLDYVISTVPKGEDLDYDQALAIARRAIFDRFGTPEAELDAMGVYPNFYNTPYQDEVNEWELYFSPRRDVDIYEDHDYEAPGEYRVWIDSPSGEVTNCIWYLDSFFPDYARRTWDAGKQDYVFSQAKKIQFYEQSAADQDYFIDLFKAAGYDVSALEKTDEQKLTSIDLQLAFAEADENLLHEDSPEIKAAIVAMEQVSGLTLEQLEKACFTLLPSPLASDTLDFCFCFNYEVEDTMFDETQAFQWQAHSYVSRLGMDMVCLDPDTLTLVKSIHAKRPPAAEKADDPTVLLGRRDWTVKDLPEFEELLAQATELDRRLAAGEIAYEEARKQYFAMMRSYGGDYEL